MQSLYEAAPEIEELPVTGVDPWRVDGYEQRVIAARRRGRGLRERLGDEPPVASVRTLPLLTVGYPTRWAFWGTAMVPSPYLVVEHRAVLVQFWQRGRLKTLLYNPTDIDGIDHVPYYVNERERRPIGGRLMLRKRRQAHEALLAAGLGPDDVDYLAFDHFHLQDLRAVLGTTTGQPPRYPRATLLVPEAEWRHWDDLHPLQRPFFLASGKRDVCEDRVVATHGDLKLGDGVFLVRTPGHTPGHQTLFLKTDVGVWGVSENGVSADNWTPEKSRIPGVATRARAQGLEVLPNFNAPVAGGDQYASMLLEKHVVDAVREDGGFVQMFPSFEATSSPLTPGMRPHQHHGVSFGRVVAASRLPPPPPLAAPTTAWTPLDRRERHAL